MSDDTRERRAQARPNPFWSYRAHFVQPSVLSEAQDRLDADSKMGLAAFAATRGFAPH